MMMEQFFNQMKQLAKGGGRCLVSVDENGKGIAWTYKHDEVFTFNNLEELVSKLRQSTETPYHPARLGKTPKRETLGDIRF